MSYHCSFSPNGCANRIIANLESASGIMSAAIEQKALGLVKAFERAGKLVSRVTVDGRKIELVLMSEQPADEFERIDMRHGKT